MIRIIHISDIHWGKYKSHNKRIKSNIKKIWDKYFSSPEKRNENYLLVAGDMTDDGKAQQYKDVQELLSGFKGRILLAPGNHDYGPHGVGYKSTCAKAFDTYMTKGLAGFKETYFSKDKPITKVLSDENGNQKVLSIGLNGCLKTKSILDTACGELGKSQWQALKRILKDSKYKNMWKIVYLHHHPFVQHHLTHRLYDSEKLMLILYDKIDILAFGHMHKRKKCEEDEDFFDIKHIADAGYFPDSKSVFVYRFSQNGVSAKDELL